MRLNITWDKIGRFYKDWTLPHDFYMRIHKAQIKLDKLKNNAIKNGK